MSADYELPLPEIWLEDADGTNLFVPEYQRLITDAANFRAQHRLLQARERQFRVAHFAIDFALTFCRRGGELSLFPHAMKDVNNVRRHLWRNGRVYTSFEFTMDAHGIWHIGNRTNWVDRNGKHPETIIQVTPENFEKEWWLNRNAAFAMYGDDARWEELHQHVAFLVQKLARRGLPLTIWPVHGVLGAVDSCIVPSLHQDVQFLALAAGAHHKILAKGVEDLWEEYSPFSSGVARFFDGARSISPNDDALRRLMRNDMIVISGEALSHCVGMALLDFIEYCLEVNPKLLERIFLLVDCTSAVPGFEAQAAEILQKAKAAGIRIVPSDVPMEHWDGVNPQIFAELRRQLA
jgi:nicotinamidase-related amidase